MAEQNDSTGGGEQAGGTTVAARRTVGRLVDALTERQQRALTMIGEGQSIRQISETIGADRGTVYRWIRTDPHFRAAYNAWQLQQRESCRAALLKVAEKAVKRISDSVEMNSELAWKLVKELGLLSKDPPVHTDPRQVEREIAIEQQEAEDQLLQRESEPEEEAREIAITSMLRHWVGQPPTGRPAAKAEARSDVASPSGEAAPQGVAQS